MTIRGKTFAGRCVRLASAAALLALSAACSDNMAADAPVGPKPGPSKKSIPGYEESVFGDEGLSVGSFQSNRRGGVLNGILGGGDNEGGGQLPVNKYIWQASLDTLAFLPLASTDPFTGVIATDWGATADAPDERFKVTAYILSPALSAASLKVAVYREIRRDNSWIPAAVDPQTAVKLENAILTRAREMRIADTNTKKAKG